MSALDAQRPSPLVDLLAGGFFLLWAGVGWISYAFNTPLRASLWAGADPGPALLPLIILVLLSAGGLLLTGKGLWRHTQGAGGHRPQALRDHLYPLGFALSLLGLTLLIPVIGFRLPAIAFSLLWLWMLTPGGQSLMGWALRAAAALGIGLGIHMLFAGLLNVPLPG